VRIEVLCTGDELLSGATADTNSPYFMDGLLAQGERVSRATIVGDDRDAIARVFGEACARADVVLVCGGLGPTSDDVTVEALAQAMGVPLVEHAATLARLRARFERVGRTFSDNNARQARVPQGAQVVQNPVGTAPMLVLTLGGCTAFVVPGVPDEYRLLVQDEVLPRIAAVGSASGTRNVVRVRLLRTIGLPESHLDAKVRDIARAHPEVGFAFRTVAPENQLKLWVCAPSAEAAERLLEQVAAQCAAALGPHLFGQGEAASLPQVVLTGLEARGHTLAVAESCTGGCLAEALTALPGASKVFWGGVIPYEARLKTAWLKVPAALIDAQGAVSAPVARAMAQAVRASAGSDWGLSTTGYAGPGGGDAREPVGAVYIGLCGPSGTSHERHVFHGDRERVRRFAAFAALDALRRHLG
jgi:nicotinamide-nucleotide amidase